MEKKIRNFLLTQRTHDHDNTTLLVKGGERVFQAKGTKKQAGVAIKNVT